MSTDKNVFMCAVNIILMIEMREKKTELGRGGSEGCWWETAQKYPRAINFF